MSGIPSIQKNTVFLAGPMTGIARYNEPAFREYAERWRKSGWAVVSPVETQDELWQEKYGRPFNWESERCDYGDPRLPELIRRETIQLATCSGIALMPGWEKSRGARQELLIAQACGLRLYMADTMGAAILPDVQTVIDMDLLVPKVESEALQALDGVLGIRPLDDGSWVFNGTAFKSVADALQGMLSQAKSEATENVLAEANRALRGTGLKASLQTADAKGGMYVGGAPFPSRGVGRKSWAALKTEILGEPETSKPTNPKDAIGSNKVPLHLWPETASALGSLACLEGALKYGRSNFREIGVRASIYYDACRRHIDFWFEGEDNDPDSGLPHIAHALACLAIIVDAEAAGKLNDDRQVQGGFRALMDRLTPHVPRLKQLHQEKAPKHYTIADSRPEAG
jgi:hypothetical protein